MYSHFLIIFALAASVICAPLNNSSTVGGRTTIETRSTNNSTNKIEYKVLGKPHHLFIGRCSQNDNVLHQENIILYNDGKSKISATIKVQVEAQVSITCVKVYDEVPDGEGAYPTFLEGGVGHNYVIFNVDAPYGKGFHFFVQVLGYELNKENEVTENGV